jgi:hypothetical protein
MHALNILDRYLLREYLKAFVVGLIFFIALIVIVRLLDYDLKKFEDDISYITAVKIVLYQAPRRIMEMVPIAGFVAVFFTLGRMVRRNEFTAMKTRIEGGIRRSASGMIRLSLVWASPLEPASSSQLEPPVPSPVRRFFFCGLLKT